MKDTLMKQVEYDLKRLGVSQVMIRAALTMCETLYLQGVIDGMQKAGQILTEGGKN
jgi:hypothetical protein